MSHAPALDASLGDAQRRIAEVYDPSRFLGDGASVVHEISAFLQRSQRSEGSVLNWRMPLDNIADASALLDAGGKNLATLLQTTFSRGQTLHDPRYIGHQVAAPIPLAALLESVSSISNQGMTVYEMGPWSSAVERVMIDRLGRRLGLREGFGGILTSGGSLANLTALLTARNHADRDAWKTGLSARGDAGVVITSPESHYCVERATGILGLGTDACLRAGLDARGKVCPEQLATQLAGLRDAGRRVIAVVASACTTRAGVYDPIKPIAEVCQRFGVWLHVDAAHGGAACFSPQYAHYLEGIEEADSIVWDAHKMLFVPALSTYLFYKRSADQYRAANQDASYLFDAAAGRVEAYNTGLGTIECTKRAAALSLWGVWAVHGPQLFTDLVEVTYGMARRIAGLIRDSEDFELLQEPESNILLFRHVPRALRGADAATLGEFQQAVRKRLVESGQGYIVPATDGGVGALRMAVMNPLTNDEHFLAIAQSLRRFGQDVLNH